MRKIYITSIMLMICICSYAYNQLRNWVAVSPMVFTTLQLDDSPLTTPKLGGGVCVGIQYHVQYDFLIAELGVEAAFSHYRVGLDDVNLSYQMVDTKGTPFQYNGLISDRRDISNTMSLRIPLMVGTEWDYVYMMAGVKLNINAMSTNKSIARMTTSGSYDIYYEVITNVPSHGFVDHERVESSSYFKYNIDLRPCVEIGAVLNNSPYTYSRKRNKMHLGVYAEFGVLNTLPYDRNAILMTPSVNQYMQVNMSHIYTTSTVSSLNNIEIGVRYTAFFRIQKSRGRWAY